MESRSYYEILGVGRDASPEEIRGAFRRLARESHPDLAGPDPVVVERFRLVVEAWEVLGDASRRQAYDRYGARAGSSPFGPMPPSTWRRESPVVGVMREVARAAGRRLRATRGADLRLTARLAFGEAALGCRRVWELPRATDADGLNVVQRHLEFTLPSGLPDGYVIRWRGEGAPGRFGGAAGDLFVRVEVERHAWLESRGDDVVGALPLTILELIEGAAVEVPTVEGRRTLRIPPGIRPGAQIRIARAGILRRDGSRGDAIFQVEVEIPSEVSADQIRLLREVESAWGTDGRPRRAAMDAAARDEGRGR